MVWGKKEEKIGNSHSSMHGIRKLTSHESLEFSSLFF